jgi:hypothetical protein
MNGRQRWLGFLAIGLGVLALLTALPHRGWGQHVRVDVPPRVAAVPPAPAAPQSPGAFFYEGRPHAWGGPWAHHGWHAGPGFLFDGLLKLAMIFFLTALGLRLLRGWRGPGGQTWRHAGPPWHHGPPPWQEYAPPPPAPGQTARPPEPPAEPQTGPTTRL